MTALAWFGLWFVIVVLILAFFAGARRIRGSSRVVANDCAATRSDRETTLAPVLRESA